MSRINYDEKIARDIHKQLNATGITENAIFPEEKMHGNYRPRTLVDESLEYIDPTPNIHTLFIQFNKKFFWNVLLPVIVKWSPRMTSCAGICSFHPRNRECIISLSTPLLKLRPRKDLIETLLHEMIHAYLFLTNNNKDRDGHGPVFQSHMKRINKEAGTNITIYHTFHEEVKLYQQHWWRCNGPCQKKAPFFGTVRRAMNRAPGPSDFWWKEHQMTCGGQFIKVKEPEKPMNNKKKTDTKGRRNSTGTITKSPEKSSIMNWVKKSDNKGNAQDKNISKKPNRTSKTEENSFKMPNPQPQNTNRNNSKSNSISNFQNDLTKLGNSTNNVHGWGTGGPSQSGKSNSKPQSTNWNNTKSNSTSNIQTNMKKIGNNTNNVHGWGTGGPDGSSCSSGSRSPSHSAHPRLSFSGTVGGSGTGRSVLLDKYSNTNSNNSSLNLSTRTSPLTKATTSRKSTFNEESSAVKTVTCPICNKSVDELKINEHLDTCLETSQESDAIADSSYKKRKSEDNYTTSNKKQKDDSQSSLKALECPLCSKSVLPSDFNSHLDKCVRGDTIEESDDVSAHDSSSSSVNLHDSPHLCLICDKKLDPNMSLNDHLEECVASVFNESEDDDNEIENTTNETSIKTEEQILERYPCPICMTLVEESLMNDHVDICLTKSE